jgi:peroxiredoxin
MKTLLGLLIVLFSTPLFTTNEVTGYDVGDYAADFSLKNVDGKMVSLVDYKDAKGFIISITCNTCPYAIMYEQRIIDLHKKYASQGYPVIAINPNDPEQKPGDSFHKMVERASEKNYPFPYLIDESQEVTKHFGATNTPHMYILQKENDQYRVAYIGTIDNNPKSAEQASKHYIDDAIKALLSGQKVEVSKTKAVGCTIKWKSAS